MNTEYYKDLMQQPPEREQLLHKFLHGNNYQELAWIHDLHIKEYNEAAQSIKIAIAKEQNCEIQKVYLLSFIVCRDYLALESSR